MGKFEKHFAADKAEEQQDGTLRTYGLVAVEEPDMHHQVCFYVATDPPWHYSSDFFDIELKKPVTDLAQLGQKPVVNLLHYPRLAADQRDKPPFTSLWRTSRTT